MKGGRPPMAPNRLSRKRAMQLCADKESPLDIMFDNMLFWHRQSKNLGAKLEAICKKIKNDDDRHEAMSVARTLLSARENAQRCAPGSKRARSELPSAFETVSALSVRAAAEELTRRGVPAPSGGRWHPTQVARVRRRLAA